MAEQQPPMGPPEEMKQVEYLVGTWNATGRVMVDPSKEQWMDYTASLAYDWILDKGALRGFYASGLMGMDIKGHFLLTYDREKQEWQNGWMDNLAARQVIYTGTLENDTMVVEGEDLRNGSAMRTRISTKKKSDTELDWKMEMSADAGATWMLTAEATYKKQ